MAQNYAQKTLDIIDERFALEAKTEILVNNGIRLDFAGVNTVTIYNVNVVQETNYVRNGYNRFGSLVELGNGVETFVLSQDKAFTFSVDRGNLEDSMMAQEANKAVKRQVREVSIPTTDIYRLSVMFAYARANGQGAVAVLTNSTTFTAMLNERSALVDALVGIEDLVLIVRSGIEPLLMTDPQFKLASNLGFALNQSGLSGQVLGMDLMILPTSYLPANCNFMIVWKSVLVAPTKFNMVRILDTVPGIDGVVAEGRRYYDAFIPTNKGVGIRAHASS